MKETEDLDIAIYVGICYNRLSCIGVNKDK